MIEFLLTHIILTNTAISFLIHSQKSGIRCISSLVFSASCLYLTVLLGFFHYYEGSSALITMPETGRMCCVCLQVSFTHTVK